MTTKDFQTHIRSFCSTNERMEDATDQMKGEAKTTVTTATTATTIATTKKRILEFH